METELGQLKGYDDQQTIDKLDALKTAVAGLESAPEPLGSKARTLAESTIPNEIKRIKHKISPPPSSFREPKVKLLITHKSAMARDLSSVSPDYIDSNFDFDPKPRVSENVSRKGKSGSVQLILDVDGDGSVLNSSVFNDASAGQIGDDLAKEAMS